jgi:hypothetical protein
LETENNKPKNYTPDYEDEENSSLKFEIATFADGSRVQPRIKVDQHRKYVAWRDNASTKFPDYPNKLIELYNSCPLHHAIIDMKAELIAGDGLKLKDENSPKAQQTLAFIEEMNFDGENLTNINKHLAFEQAVFNMFSTQLIFRKDWSYIQNVKYIGIANLRIQAPNEKGEINGYYWAFDWSRFNQNKMVYIEKFNPKLAQDRSFRLKDIEKRISENNADIKDIKFYEEMANIDNTQLYIWRQRKTEEYYYSLPEYVACISDLEIDILARIYAASSLANGFDPGFMMTFLGDPSNKTTRDFAKKMIRNYKGARKAGMPILNFVDSFEDKPMVEQLSNQNPMAQKYKLINELTQQNILSGHRIPSASIVGIQTAGKLGDSNNLVQGQEAFYNNYIKPKQNILEKYWNTIMKYNGLDEVVIAETNVFNENKIESQQNNISTENKQ